MSARTRSSMMSPFCSRKRLMPLSSTGLLLAANGPSGPRCVPVMVQRQATRSPWATRSSVAKCRSGKAAAKSRVAFSIPARLLPARLREGRREGMLGGDAGFGVIPRKSFTARRTGQPLGPKTHPFAVPLRSVLFLQKQQSPCPVHPRRKPRGVQVHEGEQREGLGKRTHRVMRQKGAEADRLLAQLDPDGLLRLRGEVPFVEKQVDHLLDGGQPRTERLERRRLDVERGLSQALARATEAFVHVGFRGEQAQGRSRRWKSHTGL